MKTTAIRTIYELLSPIFAGLDKTFSIKTVTEITAPATGVDGKWRLDSCCTRWLTIGRVITIASVDYRIVDLVCNVSVTVTGASIPTAQDIQIYAPNFIHGTITQTAKETAQQPDATTWLPLIFLHDITRERFNTNPLEPVSRRAECDLYVMTERGKEGEGIDDTTSAISEYCVSPMRNLTFDIVQLIQKNKIVSQSEAYDFDITDWVKWGVYISPTGAKSNYFTENLSGCALKYEIPFIDKDLCC